MAYQSNIPQATDLLAVSQGDILNNFSAISTYLNVNHVDFNGADQGKHKWVTFPVQSMNPPVVFNAGEIGVYSFLSPVTGVNELYINKTNQVTVVQNTITASVLSTTSAPANNSSGWSYLPSGIIIKWGNGNANGNTAITFPVAANIPVFTEVFSVQLTTFVNSAVDTNTFVRLSAFTNVGFNCYGSSRTATGAAACSFQYLAIGY